MNKLPARYFAEADMMQRRLILRLLEAADKRRPHLKAYVIAALYGASWRRLCTLKRKERN